MTELQQKIQDVYNKINVQEYSSLTVSDKDVINLCLIKMFELHSINNQIIELNANPTEENVRLIDKEKRTMINFLTEMNEIVKKYI